MILKARHNRYLIFFFKFYTLWKLKRNFHDIKIVGNLSIKDKSTLIISNHISWWDGFWIYYLVLKRINKKFYFMMLEDQLKKYWIFNHTGGYSIKKKNRSIIESIQYTSSLLENPENAVLIFPQGDITSMYNTNIKFQEGINKIVSAVKHKTQVIFVVNLTDYFSFPKPTLSIYIDEGAISDNLENQFQQFYNSCVQKQLLLK